MSFSPVQTSIIVSTLAQKSPCGHYGNRKLKHQIIITEIFPPKKRKRKLSAIKVGRVTSRLGKKTKLRNLDYLGFVWSVAS